MVRTDTKAQKVERTFRKPQVHGVGYCVNGKKGIGARWVEGSTELVPRWPTKTRL